MSKSKLREEYEAMFGAVWGSLRLHDAKGNLIYWENSSGSWIKQRYDTNGNCIYDETSEGCWWKCEYDDDGEEIYYENSSGVLRGNRTCNGKVFIDEQTGKKFKMMEIK